MAGSGLLLSSSGCSGGLLGPRTLAGQRAALAQGFEEAGHGIALALQAKGLLLQGAVSVVVSGGEDAADFLLHHRWQLKPPADRRQHAMGAALHRVDRLMEEGLAGNAELKGQRREPKGAASGLVKTVALPSWGQGDADVEAPLLQLLRQGLQIRRQGPDGAWRQRAGGQLGGQDQRQRCGEAQHEGRSAVPGPLS